jgi:hypothetical protein
MRVVLSFASLLVLRVLCESLPEQRYFSPPEAATGGPIFAARRAAVPVDGTARHRRWLKRAQKELDASAAVNRRGYLAIGLAN